MGSRLESSAGFFAWQASTEKLSWRLGVSTAVPTDPLIKTVRVTSEEIVAELMDGRTITVPLAWSWRLSGATPAQRSNFRIVGTGQGIHWPDVDEDISVEGMLRGSPAPGGGVSDSIVRDASSAGRRKSSER